MSNDKMQDEFEAAIAEEAGQSLTAIQLSRKGDSYSTSPLIYAWWAWQASRKSLVIELPYADQEFEYRHGGTTYFDGPEYRDAVFKAVESHGIKVVSP
jgi:hypothetical protein